ncbi:MAG: permease-like cell division protein FtsX [Candidatus Eremiobacteraeota bacterium]|nr:permease-like cell division protein FtsX [Candidatus Eremiobacteraeota bacterium]
MDWGKVRFFCGEVSQNFSRNMTMALTAIGTVTVSIVLLGTFLFLRQSFDMVMTNITHQVTIAAYLKDDVSRDRVASVVRSLRADRRINQVRFVSKRDAMRQLRQTLRGQMNLDIINSNPLPDALIIHTVVPDAVGPVAQEVAGKSIVANVNYSRRVTDTLLKAAKFFSAAGAAIVGLLFVATSLLIYNTIRLTVYARQREIHIMQLVGATRWAVRWPFVFEGILSGLFGALLGIGVLAAAYRYLAPKLSLTLPFVPLKLGAVAVKPMAIELLIVGALVGMFASLFSVGRSLQTA